MIKLKRRRQEGGFVTVWLAVCLFALLGFAGLAIDIANWHVQAAKIQRAADAASMAGVTRLPDEVAAKAVVKETLAKNGIVEATDPSVTVSTEVLLDKQLRVTIKDANVKTIFASFVIDHIRIERRATAEHRDSIRMGSPFNMLGSGTFNQGDYRDVKYEGYWLAINGHCTAAEDGDMFASRYDGNKGTADGSLKSVCDGSRGELNPYYKSITHLDGGYNFLVTMPAGAPPSHIGVMDPAFNVGAYNSRTRRYSADQTQARTGDPPPVINTRFRIFETDPSTVDYYDDDVLLRDKTFVYGENAMNWYHWTSLGVNTVGKTYRINVTTPDDGLARSYGVNTFQFMVFPDVGKWEDHYVEAKKWVCDSRFQPLCPNIKALEALSVQLHGGGSTANLFLTSLDASYAGDAIHVGLFDPGEASESVRLLRPDLYCQSFNWSTPPKLGAPGMSGSASGETCGDSSKLYVDGTSEVLPGRSSDAKFNDRMVTLSFRLPNNYADVIASADGTTYWRVKYESEDSTNPNRDRTTWAVKLVDGGPVRLVRD